MNIKLIKSVLKKINVCEAMMWFGLIGYGITIIIYAIGIVVIIIFGIKYNYNFLLSIILMIAVFGISMIIGLIGLAIAELREW